MTPDQLRTARARLGLTQAGLARALRMADNGARTIRRYEAGTRTIPGPVELAVEYLISKHITH